MEVDRARCSPDVFWIGVVWRFAADLGERLQIWGRYQIRAREPSSYNELVETRFRLHRSYILQLNTYFAAFNFSRSTKIAHFSTAQLVHSSEFNVCRNNILIILSQENEQTVTSPDFQHYFFADFESAIFRRDFTDSSSFSKFQIRSARVGSFLFS